jgi:hypothetical protein
MFTRSGLYYLAHHTQRKERVQPPLLGANQNDPYASSGQEELGVFLRL